MQETYGVPSRQLPGSSRSLMGRWVGVTQTGEQVLEFLVTGDPLDWRPLAEVNIWFRNGKRKTVLVMPSASTTPGTIDMGSLVRLALQIDAAVAKDVAGILLICGEGFLRILL